MTIRSLLGVLAAAWAGSALLATASWAQMPPAAPATISPPPTNQARIWFYRDLSIYSSLATPYVRLNGAAIGVSQPGGAFYADVPPGHYHISADSYLDDPNGANARLARKRVVNRPETLGGSAVWCARISDSPHY